MDAYHAIEQFKVRAHEAPIDAVSLGSSVSIWGIVPEIFEEKLGLKPGSMVNGAVQGGVAFDGWCMVRRNEEALSNVKIAVIEVNPQLLSKGMDDDDRIALDLSQRATLEERLMVSDRRARRREVEDFLLPLWSARRPLGILVRNVVHPEPETPLYPKTGGRLSPYKDWFMEETDLSTYKPNLKIPADLAASRIIGKWKPSELEDHSIRCTLDWFRSQGALIILHQFPTHPLAIEAIRKDPKMAASLKVYDDYIKSLGIPEEQMFIHLEISDCNVPLVGMRDYSHFNQIGAEAYCKHLGDMIRQLLDKGVTSEPAAK
jgi:hypothetical protein